MSFARWVTMAEFATTPGSNRSLIVVKTGVIGLCLSLEKRKGGSEAEEEVSRNISMQKEQTGCAREQLRFKA